MNVDEEESLTPDEELRAENEIRALNLDLKFGGSSFIGGDAPPELISEWLKNIEAFETSHANAEMASVNSLIGNLNIDYKSMNDTEISANAIQIEKLLAENNIQIERPDKMPDDFWLKFLVDDLLPFKTTKPIGDMILYLDYNDFYQDTPNFIPMITQLTVEGLLDMNSEFPEDILAEDCRKVVGAITKEEALQSVHLFKNRYSKINPIAYSNFEQQFTSSAAYQIFGLKWNGVNNETGELEEYEGEGICQLFIYDREWKVQGITFPGFDF